MAKKTRHILVMKNGREIPITGITGRYYITRESQYRKDNPEIKGVRTATDEEREALAAAEERRKRKRNR
jgi:hypothetical protein|nr:MAG TPA: hypothetical protein [Caudoviricetes sp.]